MWARLGRRSGGTSLSSSSTGIPSRSADGARRGFVVLSVEDTGPGIPDDILPQVMEPLFSTKPFGTGLGLPTVKRIMEQHDGGVEVDSAPGSGTRVVLWLPAENSGGGDVGR